MQMTKAVQKYRPMGWAYQDLMLAPEAQAVMAGEALDGVPNLVWRSGAGIVRNKLSFVASDSDMSRFDYLTGNLPNLMIQLVIIWITAAFLEELALLQEFNLILDQAWCARLVPGWYHRGRTAAQYG